MKKAISRFLIVGLLVFACVLAITQRPKIYYPLVDVEVNDFSNASTAAVNLSFLFDGHRTMHGCESVIGNISRTLLSRCPQCRVTQLQCDSSLTESQRNLFSDKPLAVPSARMAHGVILFNGVDSELSLAVCVATAVQTVTESNPIKCFGPNTLRTKPAAQLPLIPWAPVLLFVCAFAAWLFGWFIIKYEHLHAHLSYDYCNVGPQKYHTQPTPRIGGLALMAGLLAAGGIMLVVADSSNREFGLLLFAGLPAFLGGLAEDVTKKINVIERLLLTMLSGAIAAWLLGAALNRLDIPVIDRVLVWLPVAVVFTAFAVSGIANAINIIDGYNGLAGGVTVIVLTAMAYVANLVGDHLVFFTALVSAGALLGFLVWNWPNGKIFLGDGGAYLTGFLLAELSVLLVVRNPEVSPWFPLALLISPTFETLYSIYRRKFQDGLSPGQPDNKHMHQLIHDYLIPRETLSGVSLSELERNNRVAKYFWVLAVVISVPSVMLYRSTTGLICLAVIYCVVYTVAYRRIVKLENDLTLPRKRSMA